MINIDAETAAKLISLLINDNQKLEKINQHNISAIEILQQCMNNLVKEKSELEMKLQLFLKKNEEK